MNEKTPNNTFESRFISTEKGAKLQILVEPSEVEYLVKAILNVCTNLDEYTETKHIHTLLHFCETLIPDEKQYEALAVSSLEPCS